MPSEATLTRSVEDQLGGLSRSVRVALCRLVRVNLCGDVHAGVVTSLTDNLEGCVFRMS
jgi:hypothetical protein